MFKVPILVIGYNRPDNILKVINVLREIKPQELFIAIDGPKNNFDDSRKVSQVIKVVSQIDWKCNKHENFSTTNQGCRNGVVKAIDWFFSNVEEGIILEDDIIPDLSFFPFTEELLKKFRCDNRVSQIGGTNYNYENINEDYSYFFTKYVSIWGWATWKRAWRLFDRNLEFFDKNTDFLSLNFKKEDELIYQKQNFINTKNKLIDSWGYIWSFTCLSQNGLTILPKKNLVKNIGFGENSTHTKSFKDELKIFTCEFPLKHPGYIIRSQKYEDSYFNINIRLVRKIINCIKSIYVKKNN